MFASAQRMRTLSLFLSTNQLMAPITTQFPKHLETHLLKASQSAAGQDSTFQVHPPISTCSVAQSLSEHTYMSHLAMALASWNDGESVFP